MRSLLNLGEKLQASFTLKFSINFKAFKLQNSAAPGGCTPRPPYAASPVCKVYNYLLIIHSIESLENNR